MQTCAFTGHRPQKFPWRYDESADACIALKNRIAMEIQALVMCGCRTFLSGMALGTDQWAASAVLALRHEIPDIQLHCALPCEDQDRKWNPKQKESYHTILGQADSVVYVSRLYTTDCMLKRNHYMVDQADMLLAVYNGEKRGGTAATVRYAKRRGREILILNPITLTVTHEPLDAGEESQRQPHNIDSALIKSERRGIISGGDKCKCKLYTG